MIVTVSLDFATYSQNRTLQASSVFVDTYIRYLESLLYLVDLPECVLDITTFFISYCQMCLRTQLSYETLSASYIIEVCLFQIAPCSSRSRTLVAISMRSLCSILLLVSVSILVQSHSLELHVSSSSKCFSQLIQPMRRSAFARVNLIMSESKAKHRRSRNHRAESNQ